MTMTNSITKLNSTCLVLSAIPLCLRLISLTGSINQFQNTLFPYIVAVTTILFRSWSESTIQGRELFKEGNYSSEETILLLLFGNFASVRFALPNREPAN